MLVFRIASIAMVAALAFGSAACAGTLLVRGALARGAGHAVVGTGRAASLGAGSLTLRGTLAEIASSGSGRAVISIERGGAIQYGGRRLATLEQTGEIVAHRGFDGAPVRIGRISEGRIFETAAGGSERAIGRVLARTRGGRVALRQERASDAVAVDTLRSGASAELLAVRGDWYHLRLLSGATGWVWAPLIALSTVLLAEVAADNDGTEADATSPVHVSFKDGSAFWARNVNVSDGVVSGTGENGAAFAADAELLAWLDRAAVGLDVDWTSTNVVRLRTGLALQVSSRCFSRSGVNVLPLYTGELFFLNPTGSLVVDPALIETGC